MYNIQQITKTPLFNTNPTSSSFDSQSETRTSSSFYKQKPTWPMGSELTCYRCTWHQNTGKLLEVTLTIVCYKFGRNPIYNNIAEYTCLPVADAQCAVLTPSPDFQSSMIVLIRDELCRKMDTVTVYYGNHTDNHQLLDQYSQIHIKLPPIAQRCRTTDQSPTLSHTELYSLTLIPDYLLVLKLTSLHTYRQTSPKLHNITDQQCQNYNDVNGGARFASEASEKIFCRPLLGGPEKL